MGDNSSYPLCYVVECWGIFNFPFYRVWSRRGAVLRGANRAYGCHIDKDPDGVCVCVCVCVCVWCVRVCVNAVN